LSLARFVSASPEQFAALMNEQAKNLGLTATYFSNPVGWDTDDSHSSALDLMKITQEFLRHKELTEIVKTKQTQIISVDGKHTHDLLTTNKLLLNDPKVMGIKTGFTSKALGNLVIMAEHNNRRIVTIVLGSESREVDSQKLLDWVLEAYRW
jgi:D-alanyl-D-alanine carboxypeptidase